MDEVQESLIRNMKRARSALGYSQMKLAELCDLSAGFIAEIETGKKFPSSSTLLKISQALGLRPYQLFLDDEKSREWNRTESITSLGKELKQVLNSQIDVLIKKHIS